MRLGLNTEKLNRKFNVFVVRAFRSSSLGELEEFHGEFLIVPGSSRINGSVNLMNHYVTITQLESERLGTSQNPCVDREGYDRKK